jgi:hypothetical protein
VNQAKIDQHFRNFVWQNTQMLERNLKEIHEGAMFLYLGFIPCSILPVPAAETHGQQAGTGAQVLRKDSA